MKLLENFNFPCIICPLCHHSLKYSANFAECTFCKEKFDIIDGNPDLRTVFEDKQKNWSAAAFDWSYRELEGKFEDPFAHAARAGIPDFIEQYRQNQKGIKIKTFIQENFPEQFLDIGCGCGWLCLEMAEKLPEAEFYGIDVSPFRIKLFREKIVEKNLAGKIYAFAANAENLPFPDHFFDLILIQEALEHLRSPNKCFREIERVLAPKGHVILTTPTWSMKKFWTINAIIPTFFKRIITFEKIFNKPEIKLYDHPIKSRQLKKLFNENGFIVKKWEKVIFLPHESYLHFLPEYVLKHFLTAAKVIQGIPFCRFLGLHHLVILKKTVTDSY